MVIVCAMVGACAPEDTPAAEAAQADSARDSAVNAELVALARTARARSDSIRKHTAPPPRAPRLSALAEEISAKMVFIEPAQGVFVAATRKGRLLLDLGRVDRPVKSPPEVHAYREVISARSPVRPGDRFRLRGAWGADDATVTDIDVWNGRIVAVLAAPPAVASLARRNLPVSAAAFRASSASQGTPGVCSRTGMSEALGARVKVVRDSVSALLRADIAGLPQNLLGSLRVQASHAVGCFGAGRVLLLVTRVTGNYQRVREVALLIDESGATAPVRVADFRFRTHEATHALDADGDGIDDLAAQGRSARVGGIVILKLTVTPVARLDHLASGFSWER